MYGDTLHMIMADDTCNKVANDSVPNFIETQLSSINQQLDILIKDGTDFAATIEIFSIPLIISSLTLMIPFIFSIITRIDDKYEADKFSKLFTSYWAFYAFFTAEIVAIILIGAYALCRNTTNDFGWSVVLFIVSVCVVVFSIFLLFRALHLNNPLNMLDVIFTEYDNGFCSHSKSQAFYSLCLRMVHYGIVSDIAILRAFIDKFVNLHISKSNEYSEDFYHLMCDIVADYKSDADNIEINFALAYLYSTLLDYSPTGCTKQDTYNYLMYVMYLCIQNKHFSFINDFQRYMRFVYYIIEDNRGNTINDSRERASRLRLFSVVLNALLYGKDCNECVDDAIRKNFDAVIIGDITIIPVTSNECLDLYMWVMAVVSYDNNFKYYMWVFSDMTSETNATNLHNYLSRYFAYLIKTQHRNDLFPEEIRNSAYLRDDIIQHGFEGLIHNAPDKDTEVYIRNLEKRFIECQQTIFTEEQIDKDYCELAIARIIAKKRLDITLQGLATFESIYMQSSEKSYNLKLEKTIERKALLSKCIGDESRLISYFDFGSRIIDAINDSLADIYNGFEKTNESVRDKQQLMQRIHQFTSKYDYMFLTTSGVCVGEVTKDTYLASGKFSQFFPPRCVIVIAKPDLPYIEWIDKKVSIISVNKAESESMTPEVNVKIDLHMKIHYKSTTKIHVIEMI